MTVKNIKEAWNEANKLIPCDYLHDSERSHNAGYDIYFSTKIGVNAWISDLGNRLEVNLPNGDSVNIWIEEEEETQPAEVQQINIAEMIEATAAVKKMSIEPLYSPEKCEKVTICIDGYSWTDSTRRKVYEAIRNDHPSILWDILERYAETHGKKWRGMWGAKATHYGNKNDPNHGHYIVEGYISEKA